MTGYSGNINNLLQGVSQQPRRDRRPEQLSTQENCISNVTRGTGKRPGTSVWVDDLDLPGFFTAKKHTYDRGDGSERYTLVAGSGTLNVVDLMTGTERTVTGDASYLLDTTGSGLSPDQYLKLFTIADTTFVVNTTKVVAMNIKTSDPCWQCCLYLSTAKYGKDYIVYADGVSIASVTTPTTVTLDPTTQTEKTINLKASDTMLTLAEGAGAVVAIPPVQATMYLWLSSLFTSTAEAAKFAVGNKVTFSNNMPYGPEHEYTISGIFDGGISGYDKRIDVEEPAQGESGSVCIMTKRPLPANPIVAGSIRAWASANSVSMYTAQDSGVVVLQSNTPHTIEVSDDESGETLRTIGTTFDQYSKLPPVCTHGFKVKIIGEDADVENDYYVQFERTDNATGVGRGIWRECAGFSEDVGFDASTMPHQIVSNADGTFTISECEWDMKLAGDEDSNPAPSFVGSTITSMGLYQNRFVFLTEENCVASRAFDHFNMFSESVIQASDADPIDVSSSDNQITNLEHILIFNSSLLIMSDKAQFLHSGDKSFTSKTFSLASKSQFSASPALPPVASATSAFFAYNRGEYTGIREFNIDQVTGGVQAESVTTHILEYISGTPEQIASSTDHNVMFVRASGAKNTIYVYEWFDQEGTRKQASWHSWIFPMDILHMDIIQDTLYLWYEQSTGNFRFVTMDIADRNTTSISFPIRLDLCSHVQAVDSGTTWFVPRVLATLKGIWDDVVVTGGTNSGTEGAAVTWTAAGDDSGVHVKKTSVPDAVGTPWFYIGRKYSSVLTITNPFVRDSKGIPKTASRTSLKYMQFNLADTGFLKAVVTKNNAPTYATSFDSKVIGSALYNLNSAAPLQDGYFKVPIRADSDRCTVTLSSDSHLPFYVLDVEWAGSYAEIGRRTI